MMVLTSNGLSSPSLLEELKKYIKSTTKKAAIITTASVAFKEKDSSIQKIKSDLHSVGLESIDCFDIEFEDPQSLTEFDLIYILGGDPYYLLHYARKTSCSTVFEQFIKEDKIIIGSSAGSIVLGTDIGIVNEFTPQDDNDKIKVTDFTGLKLTHINLCPHISRNINVYDNFLNRVDRFEESNKIKITKIDDGEAIFITSNRIYKI